MAASVFVACSDDDNDSNNNNNDGGWSNNPAAGRLYGEDFNSQSGKSKFISFYDVQSIQLELSSELFNCSAPSSEEYFPIKIIVPRSEGIHTSNVYVGFSDPNSTDYVNVSSGNIVEITELTPQRVKGRIKTSSVSTDNSLNGTFNVPVCPE